MIKQIYHLNRTAIENYTRGLVNPKHIDKDLWQITSLGNYRLYVSDEDSSIGIHLLRDGYWEMWVTKFFMEFLREGDFVLDVGAHVGYYTNLFADLVGSSGEVHAFEPNQEIYQMLESGVKSNRFDNVVTYNLAVSDVKLGTATLSIPGDLAGCGSIILNKDSEEFDGYEIEELTVDVVSIDSIFEPEQIDFIKIDAEGAEEKILVGAKNVIENSPNISIALEWKASRFDDPAGIIEYLDGLGFQIFKITESGTALYADRKELLSEVYNLDMLFLKR